MIGAFPCDLEPGERLVGPGELRGIVGSFTHVADEAAAGRCGSPEDSDLCVFPDRSFSISWILCRRREQMALERFKGGDAKGVEGFIRT